MGNILKNFFFALARALGRIFNVGVKLKYVLLFTALLGGGIFAVTYKTMINNVGGKDDYAEAMRYIEIKDVVDKYYIDPVDRRTMGESAAAAMVSNLGDQWSSFMTEDEYKTFNLYSSNDYADIGMSLLRDEFSGGYQVISVDPMSPPAWAGLTPGMIITAVDGEKLSDYTSDEVRTIIRSKMSGKFILEISGGSLFINVDCTGYSQSSINYRLEKTGAGYVQINDFEAGSGEDAKAAIEDLLSQGADALVIDLRNNPGGLTSEVASLLDYLLPKGRLFSEVSKNGDEIVTESDGMCIQLPMCVLINSETYKEAELCAAVLHEYQWATLFGESTTGNTRTQETIELTDGSAIRLSTKSYLTPNGTDICRSGGVIPDVTLYNKDASATGTTEGTTGGEDGTASTTNDEQLMAALKFLS